ncbi:ABC transporter ATP-binding protein [Devosia pacifica]|uniref:ABC transporter ATP-binding protein n=1 Tax=Devosia pacifica TaxID=1335967 RepID=A0A918SF59_9HYPH|nr:ABC transporter ATP-binding protein [Devosia pacifica]GHA35975.1 ABC transporter ATP-binding protein [Devosia pacifica]
MDVRVPPSNAAKARLHETSSQLGASPHQQSRWRKFLSYYRPHLPLLVADLLCAILVAATAVALPLCANYLTTHLASLAEGREAIELILAMGAVMLLILAIQVVAIYFVDYRGHVMGARIEAAVRQELFEHCQKLSFSFYDRQRTGQLMSRITDDSLWLGELFHHGPEDLAIGLLKYLGALAVLIYIDPLLAGLIALLTPPAVLYALHFNRRMGLALDRSKQEIAAVNERVEDSLSGIRVVQSFGNETLERDRFVDHNQRFLDSRADGYRSEAWFSVGTETFAQLITILVIVAGAWRITSGALTVPEMLTFLLCVAVLVDPVQRLANFVRLWQEGYTGFKRAMDLLEIGPEIVDRPNAVDMPEPKGHIKFEDVSFGYTQDAPVLHHLGLEVKAGEFVALVGPSGVGKSTLCALIPRFYDVSTGAILIDGTDIRDVTLSSLRRHVGLVQQDVYLFSGTVAENLRYGRPDASHEDIVAAARAANAHAFISALPLGYDTDIGQRGVRLSGGQKQRLTIARAFLKNPPILIFDEATSALDNESERAVQQALLSLAKGRTTIVIAHRLSTVRHADRIVVLTGDGIAEEGTHDQLMAGNGVYAGLHTVQASI